jgi:hypothetical protein
LSGAAAEAARLFDIDSRTTRPETRESLAVLPRRYTVGSLILLMFLTSFVGASAFYLAKSMRRPPEATDASVKKGVDPQALERERQRRSTDVAVFSLVTLAIPTVVVLILSTALAMVRLANRRGRKPRRRHGPERDPLIE